MTWQEVKNMEVSSKIRAGLVGLSSVCAIVLSVVALAFSLSARANAQSYVSDGPPNDAVAVNGTPEETSAETASHPIYVMTIRDGAIVVLDGEGAITRTVGEHAIFLPADDYRLLSDGIEIYSEEELSALVEDFGN